MRADVKQLLKENMVITWGHRRNFARMEEEIRESEVLRYVDHSSYRINEKDSEETDDLSGTMFISDKRVVFRLGGTTGIISEFPVHTLHAISTTGSFWKTERVSFTTDTKKIVFSTSAHRKKVALILDDTIKRALQLKREIEMRGTSKRVYEIYNCPGCGSAQIVVVGIIETCDYCGRPLLIEKVSLPEPGEVNPAEEGGGSKKHGEEGLLMVDEDFLKQRGASVADEIMKFKVLLDEGIITEEEFEHKKRILLGL